jgi:hypothetical protein
MPYHTDQRLICNRRGAPRSDRFGFRNVNLFRPVWRHRRRPDQPVCMRRSEQPAEVGALVTERDDSSVELVRDARLTDIDRITGLMDRAQARWSLDQLPLARTPAPTYIAFGGSRVAAPTTPF